jgi:hypothetical protein
MKSARFGLVSLMLLLSATFIAVRPLAAQNVSVYATGLNGPRGLKFGPDGALYVAEAGRGGSTPAASFDCDQVPGPVGPYFGGRTARISKISGAGQRSTVVDGLPSSISSLPSGDTEGVSDVAFVDGKLFALLAGGGCSHGNPATPNGVIQVDALHHTWHYVANLSAFLKANPPANPGPSLDDWEPDGTWYSMIAVNDNLYATEPNHQEIDRISPTTGAIHRVVDVSGSSTAWVGPTSLVFRGSNFFFGNLAPFPIVLGSASIFKLAPSGGFELLHPGLTTVVGLVFGRNNSLYALELSAAPGFPNPGAGKIVRVSPSGQVEDILTGLVVPTAMTLGPDGALYVSNFGAAPPGLGQILRVQVP